MDKAFVQPFIPASCGFDVNPLNTDISHYEMKNRQNEHAMKSKVVYLLSYEGCRGKPRSPFMSAMISSNATHVEPTDRSILSSQSRLGFEDT